MVGEKFSGLDLHGVDLPDLLADLIKDRSMYAVLDAFIDACGRRARVVGADLEQTNQDPTVELAYRREMDLLECAAENLRLTRAVLETDAEIRGRSATVE